MSRLMTRTALMMLAAFALASPAMHAQEPWRPVAPDGLPTDFDWIRLPSDEWLKGEIISMYDRKLDFDSDELGKLSFDFEDVKEIRSASIVQVGFERREPLIGRLHLNGDSARVVGERDATEFPSSEILSLIVGRPKEINYWSASAHLGGNVRSGNTEQVDYSARFGATRRTLKNRIALDYIGNITRIDTEDTSNNHLATLGWDLFVSKRFFVNVVGAEWYRDPFQNIANRWTLAAGLGYELVDTKKTTWDVSGGPAWQGTEFISVSQGDDESVGSPALGIGTRLDHELTSDIDLYLGFSAFFTDRVSGSYNHHLDTGIELDLVANFDLNVSWVWDRIQDPRPLEDGSVPEQDDYRLIFGLGWDF